MTQNDSSRSRSFARSWRDEVLAEFNRFRSTLTRENIISNLKTLAWVIPLTLLIWIWAEREQVQPDKDVAVPFELVSMDANRVVTLKPPQDTNLVLELQGPQARLQELRSRLSGGQMPKGIRLEVPNSYAVNRDYTIPSIELIRNQRIFADYGVTVISVQPVRLEISVDELVDREAKIIVPPDLRNVEATFAPPTVKVRGPVGLLNRVASQSPADRGQLVVYAEGLPRSPGSHDVDVIVAAPEVLRDDRVRINDAKLKVRAHVEVRQADKTFLYNSMPVTIDWPEGMWRKYDCVIDRAAVQNVTVIGPQELIDAMQKPDFEPKPKARLVVTGQDLTGETRKKIVEYDLPEGVHVSPEDRKKTVEFKVVDRAATATP